MSAADQPEVSIVISVHNRAAMLMDCFRGIAAQSLARERFEVVLIDNCSTEALQPVIDEARRTLGLHIVSARTSEDRGPAPARNLGVGMARGPIIAFTDSDCRPTPRWLELGMAAMAEPAVSLVSGPVLPKPEQAATFFSKLSFVTVAEHPTFPTANLMVRRDVFDALGGFDASLSFRDPFRRATECADTDLAWRIIEAGHQRRFVAEAVMHHEIERQGVLMWLLEPTRLFLLPELVRRHPQLRSVLLRGGFFFYPKAMLALLGLPILLALLWWQPALLVAMVLLLVMWAAWRTRSLHPVALLRFCAQAPLHLARLLVMNASLLYGSVRFRSLVL